VAAASAGTAAAAVAATGFIAAAARTAAAAAACCAGPCCVETFEICAALWLTDYKRWSASCLCISHTKPRQPAVSAPKLTDLQFELVYDFDGNLLPRNVMDPHPDFAEPPFPYGFPYAVPWQPVRGSCLSSCYWTARVTNRMPYSPCSLWKSMITVSLICS